jgi:hypothetical protein
MSISCIDVFVPQGAWCYNQSLVRKPWIFQNRSVTKMPESTAETAHTSSETATEVSPRESLHAANLTTATALSTDSLAILGPATTNPEENDKARTEASLLEDASVLTELAMEAVSVTSNSTLSEAVMVKTARNGDTGEVQGWQ